MSFCAEPVEGRAPMSTRPLNERNRTKLLVRAVARDDRYVRADESVMCAVSVDSIAET